MFGVVGVVSYYVEIGGTVTLTDIGVVGVDVEAFEEGVTGIYVISANVKVGTGYKMELVGEEAVSTKSTWVITTSWVGFFAGSTKVISVATGSAGTGSTGAVTTRISAVGLVAGSAIG